MVFASENRFDLMTEHPEIAVSALVVGLGIGLLVEHSAARPEVARRCVGLRGTRPGGPPPVVPGSSGGRHWSCPW